mgnify:CR=1 FL=1
MKNPKFNLDAMALDGKLQAFNTYLNKNKKYMVRFYTDNYVPKNRRGAYGAPSKNWDQWSGKGCSFKNYADAVKFGYKIASAVTKARDWPEIKRLVELEYEHKKAFA